MSWYKDNKDVWREIIETVAAEEHRTTQMVEKDTIQSITECFFSLTDPSIERSCYERRKSRYKHNIQQSPEVGSPVLSKGLRLGRGTVV